MKKLLVISILLICTIPVLGLANIGDYTNYSGLQLGQRGLDVTGNSLFVGSTNHQGGIILGGVKRTTWPSSVTLLWGDITGDINDQTDLQNLLVSTTSVNTWSATQTFSNIKTATTSAYCAFDQSGILIATTSPTITETDPLSIHLGTTSVSSISALPNLSITKSQVSDFGSPIYNETDPDFTASFAHSIASSTNWDTAFSWGNHALAGYLTNLLGGLNGIFGNTTTTNATTTSLTTKTLCLGAVCNSTWPGGGAGNPAGNNTQIQFNNGGVFGASSGLAWTGGSNLEINDLSISDLSMYSAHSWSIGQSDTTIPEITFDASHNILNLTFDNPNSTSTIRLGGRIGIGTSTPAKALDISNSATSTAYIYSTGIGQGGSIILEDIDGAGCTQISALNGVLESKIVACP